MLAYLAILKIGLLIVPFQPLLEGTTNFQLPAEPVARQDDKPDKPEAITANLKATPQGTIQELSIKQGSTEMTFKGEEVKDRLLPCLREICLRTKTEVIIIKAPNNLVYSEVIRLVDLAHQAKLRVLLRAMREP